MRGTPDSYQNKQPITDDGHGPLGPLIGTPVHTSAGHAPFYLLQGYEAQLPVDKLFGHTPESISSYLQYVADMDDAFEEVRQKTNMVKAIV